MKNQSLEFMLVENHLHEGSDNFMARVINQKSSSYEDVLKEMASKTAIKKQDLGVAMELFLQVLADKLALGLQVENPLGVIKPTIRGTFESLDEDFRPFSESNNHDFDFIWNPSKKLREAVTSQIRFRRVSEHTLRYPKVIRMSNLNSPDDQLFSSGHVLKMSGINLRHDPEAEDEGVFWVNEKGESVKTSVIIDNTPSTLNIQIPHGLPAGEYDVKIATRLGNHELRVRSLDQKITIS